MASRNCKSSDAMRKRSNSRNNTRTLRGTSRLRVLRKALNSKGNSGLREQRSQHRRSGQSSERTWELGTQYCV